MADSIGAGIGLTIVSTKGSFAMVVAVGAGDIVVSADMRGRFVMVGRLVMAGAGGCRTV